MEEKISLVLSRTEIKELAKQTKKTTALILSLEKLSDTQVYFTGKTDMNR